MTRNRKTATPVPDDYDFRRESVHPGGLKIQTESDFFKEVAKDVEAARSGARMPAVVTIAFESIAAFLEVLTPKRNELLEAVKEHGTFDSIEELAIALGRNRAAVSRDLRALSDAGLLSVKEAVHAGHGRRSEISPAAEKLVFSLSI